MSNTYHLVCQGTRQQMWVGQGWHAMTRFYGLEGEEAGRLGRFLEATRGHSLGLLECQEDLPGCSDEWADYEEFEKPQED